MVTIIDTREAHAVSVVQTSHTTKITFEVHGAAPMNDAACRLHSMFLPESATVTIYPDGAMMAVARGPQVLGDRPADELVWRIMSDEDDDLPNWVEELLRYLARLRGSELTTAPMFDRGEQP